MSDTSTKQRTQTRIKTERPKLHKVILVNDDYTPREFVVKVLQSVFRMGEPQAESIMMTAHQKGSAVVAVYTKEIAETKADEALELSQQFGFPLMVTTEPEE
jgi:ATP-dependent Clp protease adaptor protein ClpS